MPGIPITDEIAAARILGLSSRPRRRGSCLESVCGIQGQQDHFAAVDGFRQFLHFPHAHHFNSGSQMRCSVSVRTVVAALVVSLTPAVAVSQASDSAGVMQTIETMLGAMRQRNAEGLRSIFHEQARMTLLRPAPGGGMRAMVLTGEQFITAATNPNGPILDEPIRNPVLQIHGDLATVWAEYQVRIDGKVSHCGYDAFQFVRVAGAWKVIAVADTFRREGCGPMW